MHKKEDHPADSAQDEASRRLPHLDHPENHLKDLPPWMTTQEAAEYSGYDIQYVRRLARQGKIGAVKKGRDWWIDVEKFTVYLSTMIESEDGRAGPKSDREEAP
jgi:excisionase family DNA binding protein